MSDHEKLCDTLWVTTIWLCVLFFAFAAGVWAGEWEEDTEPVPVEYTAHETVMAAMDNPSDSLTAATSLCTREAGLDAMVEDTYLREDIPLPFELQAMLYGACLEFQVDYELALAVIEQETNFRNVTGDDGDSEGYMQIQERWWGELMAEIGAEDLTDPEDNFRTGCAILRQLLDKYGSLEDALSAYNTGSPGQTRYSREVMERMQHG